MIHTRVPLTPQQLPGSMRGKGLRAPEPLSGEETSVSPYGPQGQGRTLSPFLASVFDPESPCPFPSVSEAWTPFNLEVPDHCSGYSAVWLLGTKKAAR